MPDDAAGCKDCSRAQGEWTWGGYTANCAGCDVRRIANVPWFIRGGLFADIERRLGAAARQEYRDKAAAEFVRIRALRRAARGKQ
jgi:hypothetical protein